MGFPFHEKDYYTPTRNNTRVNYQTDNSLHHHKNEEKIKRLEFRIENLELAITRLAKLITRIYNIEVSNKKPKK